jgi:plasmid stabilization system protein ParE
MNQIRVADKAATDLDEIWLYIARDNPTAADKYVRAIVSRFPTLVQCNIDNGHATDKLDSWPPND